MQHDVVSEAGRAVDADQDAVLDGAAEAHRQAVRPRAGSLVVGPGVGDQASALPEDVGGASCEERGEGRWSANAVSYSRSKKNIIFAQSSTLYGYKCDDIFSLFIYFCKIALLL